VWAVVGGDQRCVGGCQGHVGKWQFLEPGGVLVVARGT